MKVCTNCEIRNKETAKYCSNCGNELTIFKAGSTLSLISDDLVTFNHEDICKSLDILLKNNGSLIISKDGISIKFSNEISNKILHFEVVTNDINKENIGKSLKKLGLIKSEKGDYYNYYNKNKETIQEAMKLVEKLFFDVYKLNKNGYKVESNITPNTNIVLEKDILNSIDLNIPIDKKNIIQNKISRAEKLKYRKYEAIRNAVVFILLVFFLNMFLEKVACKSNKNPHASEAVVMHRHFIEQLLKSPSSADFENSLAVKAVDLGNNRFKITSHVDSQNGFGAVIRTEYEIILRYLGGDPLTLNNWELEDYTFY
ncbi:MAG: zinc ribbon domain-containing protein [Bacteroidota bacterium]|jgi:hypothetical protein